MRYLLILLISIFLYSCEEEQYIPVSVDFSISFENDSHQIPVKIKTKNLSKGAYSYKWFFEGAVVNTSTDENPVILYTQPGKYQIELIAYDNEKQEHKTTKEVVVYKKLNALFSFKKIEDTASPVTVNFINESEGAEKYYWSFENGTPSTSTDDNPTVTFNKAGTHKVTLQCVNHKDKVSYEKTIQVTESLQASFDWSLDFANNIEVPVTIQTQNTSQGAKQYEWFIEGAYPETSTEKNPKITFAQPGNYTVNLTVSNTKAVKKISKQITITPGDNLLDFNNIKFGINTSTTEGMFFSSSLGKVLKKEEVTEENGHLIEFVFFGLNDTFNRNKFISPSEAGNYVFNTIPNATKTVIINSQEYNTSSTIVSATNFDQIINGNPFSKINITETQNNSSSFNNSKVPRVILFKTSNGRKGAIKIKQYIKNELNSYILADIKIQKFAL